LQSSICQTNTRFRILEDVQITDCQPSLIRKALLKVCEQLTKDTRDDIKPTIADFENQVSKEMRVKNKGKTIPSKAGDKAPVKRGRGRPRKNPS
jgi:hypothetical protein